MKEASHKINFSMSKVTEAAKARFLEEAGIAIATQAKQLAPVDTGLLRASINWKTDMNGSGVESPANAENNLEAAEKNTVKIGTNVEYAPWMEYGTAKLPTGKPYLRPALRMLKAAILQKWKQYIKEAENAK